MNLVLVGLLSAWMIGVYAILVAFAHIGRLPARPLADGSGHLMVHSIFEKSIAWVFAALVILGFVAGAVRIGQIQSWGLGLYVLVLCILAGWLAGLYLRKQRNRVEFNEVGLTWRRGSKAISIAWSEVTRFTEAPSMTALIVRARDGRTLPVDKLLVGTQTTFLEYLRTHLSTHLYETVFGYIRPRAAMRSLVKKSHRNNANGLRCRAPADAEVADPQSAILYSGIRRPSALALSPDRGQQYYGDPPAPRAVVHVSVTYGMSFQARRPQAPARINPSDFGRTAHCDS
jgi:hypothetical protein